MSKVTPSGIAALVLLLAACSTAVDTGRTASPDDGELDPTGGEIVIEVPDDDGQVEAAVGPAEIPADFPMPVPDGGDVINAIVSTAAGREDFHVTLRFPADARAHLVDVYTRWLADQGFEVETADGAGQFVQLSGLGNRAAASVMIADQDGALFVSLTYSE